LQDQRQVIDLLGLMGDSSDNIPGCKGVGEKTATQLLQQFGSIENLLANTDQLKGALQRKVQEQIEDIRFSYFLATIKTDVPIEFDQESLVCQEKNWDKLVPLYRELEFSSLLKQAPSELTKLDTKPVTKSADKTKKSKPQEATLDLFSQVSDDTTPLPLRYHYDDVPMMEPKESLEGRLVNYLLNPEVAYNPALPIQWDKLKEDSSLWNLYNDVELPLSQVLKEMQDAGVRIDVPMLKMAEEQLTQELLSIEQEIYSSVGLTFNVNSPKQVGEVLFDHLKLDAKAKKSKTGQYSTSEEVLLALKPKHPVVGMILEYRELKKLISTYISALPTYINPDTGKIHTTYNQTVTATGRLSSSNPNLQNLPIRSERGQLIRQAVIPDDGCLFLSADYSQIELRLMAHFSQDPHLVQAFRSGQDIHAATAAKIFNVPIEEVTKDQRRQAKTANFGIIYGISAFGLAQQLDCSRSEAKDLIDGYFAAFPGVIDYIERQKELARRQGYAVTLFGRKRYLPDIVSHNATVRSFAERNAVNSPIQGTAADIIKMAMVTIHQRLKEEGLKAQMIMQVHDELNFNVPENEVDRVREIVVSEMQNVVHLTVPLIADCGVGENWLQAH
jgi:DNA polymerase I